MNFSTQKKKAGLTLGVIAVSIVLCIAAYALIGLGQSEEEVLEGEHLFVDATYLLKTGETNSSVNVTCTLYLTNIWEEESGPIKAIVYVIEQENNLAVYKNTVSIGPIGADSTAEIEIPVVLFNSSYKIEMLIFENEKLVIKGKVTLNAYPVYIFDEVTHSQRQEWTVVNEIQQFDNVRSYIKH